LLLDEEDIEVITLNVLELETETTELFDEEETLLVTTKMLDSDELLKAEELLIFEETADEAITDVLELLVEPSPLLPPPQEVSATVITRTVRKLVLR
jgi:hypothetical protein